MFDPKLKEALSRVQKPGRYTPLSLIIIYTVIILAIIVIYTKLII